MAEKKKKYSAAKTFGWSVLALILGVLLGFILVSYYFFPKDKGEFPVSGDLQFHFLELGNKYNGDSIYVKAGETDILIDAGSRADSADDISSYVDRYCTDGVLEYVIATHADQDHIAAFAGNGSNPSLFTHYECEVIIDFPLTNTDSNTYQNYVAAREAETEAGAKHYTALQCYRETGGAQRVYELSDGITMEILYNYYYENESSDENNYSVCLLFRQGGRSFLLTGDLEEKGEEYLVEYNDLPEVELFKAGHHGSKTSSTEALLSVIRPKIVCVCCCAGHNQYGAKPENVFPTQAMIDRVANYTDRVYVTSLYDEESESEASMNGTIVVTASASGVTVSGSHNDTLLKDTAWFLANRTMPAAWESKNIA
jgi:competence protein comA